MNDAQVLGALLLATPEDDALAAALTDEVMEQGGYNANEARKRVSDIRAAGWTAREMAAAARQLQPASPIREKLHERLRDVAGLMEDQPIMVVLVEGESRRWMIREEISSIIGPEDVIAFTVGHLYVLRFAAANLTGRERREVRALLRRRG